MLGHDNAGALRRQDQSGQSRAMTQVFRDCATRRSFLRDRVDRRAVPARAASGRCHDGVEPDQPRRDESPWWRHFLPDWGQRRWDAGQAIPQLHFLRSDACPESRPGDATCVPHAFGEGSRRLSERPRRNWPVRRSGCVESVFQICSCSSPPGFTRVLTHTSDLSQSSFDAVASLLSSDDSSMPQR